MLVKVLLAKLALLTIRDLLDDCSSLLVLCRSMFAIVSDDAGRRERLSLIARLRLRLATTGTHKSTWKTATAMIEQALLQPRHSGIMYLVRWPPINEISANKLP